MARRGMRSDWGSVQEVERGRRYRIRWWAETPEGYRRCSETVRGTRRDAHDRLAALRLEHSQDAPCPTVGECWGRWFLPDFERRVSEGDAAPSSLMQYRSVWGRHVAPTWEGVPADEVQPLAVQQWLLSLTSSQAQAATHLMRRVLAYPVRYGLVATNPMDAAYVMPARSTSARRDDGIWALEELGGLWRECRGEWFEAAFLLMAFGGCRVGESLGPLGADVEAREAAGVPLAVVRVERQVTNANAVSDALKNEWSRRAVVVPGPPGERLCAISRAVGDGWLTGDGLGGHARQDRLRGAWDGMMRDTTLPRHPPKQLRPSWQTYMRWELRVPPYMIEPMMGHVGDGVTGRHYDRPMADQFCEAVAAAYAARPFAEGWGL